MTIKKKGKKQTMSDPIELLWATVIFDAVDWKDREEAIEFIAKMMVIFKQHECKPLPPKRERKGAQ